MKRRAVPLRVSGGGVARLWSVVAKGRLVDEVHHQVALKRLIFSMTIAKARQTKLSGLFIQIPKCLAMALLIAAAVCSMLPEASMISILSPRADSCANTSI